MLYIRFFSLFLLSMLALSACQPLVTPLEEPAKKTGTGIDAAVAADLAADYIERYTVVVPAPLFTEIDESLTYDDAYAIQEDIGTLLAEDGNELAGYKLALTGEQRPYGAEEPIYGRLIDFMLLDDGAVVSTEEYVIPVVELELAYFFDESVGYPVTIEELQAAVGKVTPAVELPDHLFDDVQDLSWLDLIAANIGARRVVFGAPVDDEGVDENTVVVTATYNGELVSEGQGSAVFGNQWEALRFLSERLNQRGYRVEAGDVVITGAMNPVFQAKPGSYEVDYGELGTLSFEVVE